MADQWSHEDELAALAELKTAWHVTSSLNRASIEEHGLDWRRMGATGGIATGAIVRGPELDGVFLCEGESDVDFFIEFSTHPTFDVWEADVTGLRLEPGPDGWIVCRAPIPPDRLRLVRADVSASAPPQTSLDPGARVDFRVVRRKRT